MAPGFEKRLHGHGEDEEKTRLAWTERDRLCLVGPMMNPEHAMTPACWTAVVDEVRPWPERAMPSLPSFSVTIGGNRYWALGNLEPMLEEAHNSRECFVLPFVPSKLGRWRHAPPLPFIQMLAYEVEDLVDNTYFNEYLVRVAYVMGTEVSLPEGAERLCWDCAGRPHAVLSADTSMETRNSARCDLYNRDSPRVNPLSTAPKTGNNLFVTCIFCYGPKSMTAARRACLEIMARRGVQQYELPTGLTYGGTTVELRDSPTGPEVTFGRGPLFVSPSEAEALLVERRLVPMDKAVELVGDTGTKRHTSLAWESAWRRRRSRAVGYVPRFESYYVEALDVRAAVGRRFVTRYAGTEVTRPLNYSERDRRYWLRVNPYRREGRGVQFVDADEADREDNNGGGCSNDANTASSGSGDVDNVLRLR